MDANVPRAGARAVCPFELCQLALPSLPGVRGSFESRAASPPRRPRAGKAALLEGLASLAEAAHLADVVLIADGGATRLPAHRCVLAARSRVFDRMWRHEGTREVRAARPASVQGTRAWADAGRACVRAALSARSPRTAFTAVHVICLRTECAPHTCNSLQRR
jgi:hypothetical protein